MLKRGCNKTNKSQHYPPPMCRFLLQLQPCLNSCSSVIRSPSGALTRRSRASASSLGSSTKTKCAFSMKVGIELFILLPCFFKFLSICLGYPHVEIRRTLLPTWLPLLLKRRYQRLWYLAHQWRNGVLKKTRRVTGGFSRRCMRGRLGL